MVINHHRWQTSRSGVEGETSDPIPASYAMTLPLDDVAFLANSENRVAVLEALAATPQTRQDLLDEFDGSRVTLARALRDFETRCWVERTGHGYRITPLGKWVCEEFTNLVEVIEVEHELRDVLAWFPADQLPFELECLREADIVRPTQNDPLAPVDALVEWWRTADHVSAVTYQMYRAGIKMLWEATVHGELTLDFILTPETVEYLVADPKLRVHLTEMLELETVDIWVYDEPSASLIALVDGVVGIGINDDTDKPQALIRCSDDAVRTWAEETLAAYREQADPVTTETISG